MADQNNTFWGLILQPGKRYEQVVEKSFHVSMAALDISGGNDKATVQVMINVDGQEFILCHLSKNRNPQQTLDLNFQGGDSLALYVDGQSPQPVHLTGFYNEMDDDDDDLAGLEMSDESDEEDVPALVPAETASAKKKKAVEAGQGDIEIPVKRKGSPVKESPQKKSKLQNDVKVQEDEDDDDDDDDEDDEDDEDEGEEEEDEDGEDEEVEEGFSDEDDDDDDEDDDEDDDDEDDDDEDEDDDDEDEDEEKVDEPPIPLKKTKSPAAKKEEVKANGVAKAEDTPKKQKKGAEQAQKTPVQEEKKKAAQTPKSAKKTIAGGVMIEDIIVGEGQVAKRGRPVSVYYVGRLKQNNKQFDQTTAGPGFKFRLGAKEVIKGWDVGVEGMKVGGKRRITCPPHMAYGARGSPPVIPPNSALVFEVTLKNVH
ncbi:FK506-binding nuclear protein [Amphibalanus amphitrite]|uniref:FK506-binding protein n=1 Tax=Amphibalanus amphitrite TaxID=1232801 RepID=A0A6A4WWD3_AMPAM|nr:FK506-binding nuclear protein [Amphibalanus amphitrite]